MIDTRHRPEIIIANEDAAFLSVISSYLGQFFHVKAAVRTGDDLIRVAPRMRPDAIVADMDIPVGEGIDVMVALKTLGIDPLESPIRNGLDLAAAFTQAKIHIPFVLMGSETEGVESLLQQGASAYVHKYDVYADLKQAVLLAIEGRKFISRSSVRR